MFCSIIVTYYPDLDHITSMVREMRGAGFGVVVYDNTPDFASAGKISSLLMNAFGNDCRIRVIGDGVNHGLGVGFNQSIRWALSFHPEVEGFLFFDQDSTVTTGKLVALRYEYEALVKRGVAVGVLGAQPVDGNGKPYRVRAAETECPELGADFLGVWFVISSFSLVPKSTIDKVGLFDEKLFIDLVDSEFSFRCTRHKLLNLISRKVEFPHVIGMHRLTFFGRSFSVSAPVRNYYQARNLILVGRDYGWSYNIISVVGRRFLQVFLSGVFFGKLLQRLVFFARGIFHGLMYRGGPFH